MVLYCCEKWCTGVDGRLERWSWCLCVGEGTLGVSGVRGGVLGGVVYDIVVGSTAKCWMMVVLVCERSGSCGGFAFACG